MIQYIAISTTFVNLHKQNLGICSFITIHVSRLIMQ